MNITPLQANFSSGELSPLMVNRTELDGHGTAVEVMENCIALSQGPTKNRDPLVFIASLSGGESLGRVETIQLSPNIFLIGVFLNLEVRFFFSDGSPVVEGHADNPRFSQFGDGWIPVIDFNASTVIFDRHLCTLSPRDNPIAFAGIRQQIDIGDNATDDHEFHVYSNVESTSNELHLLIGTTEGAGDLLDVIVTVDKAIVLFNPGGNQMIWIEVLNEDIGIPINVVSLTTVDVIDLGSGSQADATPYSAADLELLQFIGAPEGDTVYITHPLYPPHEIIYNDILGSVAFNIVDFGGTAPIEWDINNYPATGVVDKGRMFYAGTPLEPEQIWASVVGDFEDMTTGVNEADGFSVINSHYGAIVWMLSSGSLIFGTTEAEYLVTSVGPAIFIGDIQINRQSAYGSAKIRGRHIGDKVLYVTRDKKRLHAMQFDRDSQAWLSDEISFASEHIMLPGSKSMSYQQYPHNLVWFGLTDGRMACCNYNRPMGIYGWHEHTTQGSIIDVSAGDQSGQSHLVALVLRPNQDLSLEISDPTGSPVDGRATRQLIPAGSTVTGLEHLEGLSVQIVADGAVHPERMVQGGQIELQLDAEFVQVGLGFDKRVKTLPLDKGAPTGSARSFMKRYKDIYLGLLDSAIPFINGDLPPVRTPQVPMNTAPPLTTGLVKISNLGYDREASVDITQPGPLPLQITGLYGEVTQNKI